jgi:SWI/SNF-related matrix-associated actin-dependent regulator of chromatin subfamily A-like protein 1
MIVKEKKRFVIHSLPDPHARQAIKDIYGIKWLHREQIYTAPLTSEPAIKTFAKVFQLNFIDKEVKENLDFPDIQLPEATDLILDLKREPYPFQKSGIAYGIEKKRVLIGDHPGLGKTMQSIAIIDTVKAYPCLVVCPSIVKENWAREWEMWVGKKAMILTDTNKHTWHMFAQGKNIFGDAVKTDIFITNYESIKKFFVIDINYDDKKKFKSKDVVFDSRINIFKSVIFDESHRLKETTSNQTKFCLGLAQNKEYRLLLSGTPIVNRTRDLMPQLAILGTLNNFGGLKGYTERFCAGYDSGQSNLKELNYKLKKTCFYMRTKQEVNLQLPDRIFSVVKCNLTTRKEYNDALKDLGSYLKEYKQATDQQIKKSLRGEVMVRIGVLKNISARGKINEVNEYISDMIANEQKVIVFVHQTEIADILLKLYPNALTILGRDKTSDRQKNIDNFQSDPNKLLIIVSIKAAGVGITLTAASNCCFVDLAWHYADTDQCISRAHRIGAKNTVNATFFIGNKTIDEWIYKVIMDKKEIADEITGINDEINETYFNNLVDYLYNN